MTFAIERRLMFSINSESGNIRMGGDGGDGDLVMFPSGSSNLGDLDEARIHLDANGGNLWMGGKGADGDVVLFPSTATAMHDTTQASVWLNGQEGNMMLGGAGRDGDIALFPSDATISQSSFSEATIHLNGDAGDIVLKNADCAEEFDTAEPDVESGSVMVLDDEGSLRRSTEAYDTRVAGVVSGAGNYDPGIVLDRQSGPGQRLPIALMGKVFCRVDATEAPVGVGDMLTTAERPGHAMEAEDPGRSFGAVIGKALGALPSGRDLVPVLVSLQ